jgi:predicted acetyltransferase
LQNTIYYFLDNGESWQITQRQDTEVNQVNPLNIEINFASKDERPILRNLMELYQHDFSEYDGSDTGPSGLYNYPCLDYYWNEPERSPFLVRVDGQLAGFVLVARYNYLTGQKDSWVLAEFFVMRKYRRQGVGKYVACHIFDRFHGEWQVAQIPENIPATAFWRKVITCYTHGNFQEHDSNNDHWRGPVQMFTSPPFSGHVGEKPDS